MILEIHIYRIFSIRRREAPGQPLNNMHILVYYSILYYIILYYIIILCYTYRREVSKVCITVTLNVSTKSPRATITYYNMAIIL